MTWKERFRKPAVIWPSVTLILAVAAVLLYIWIERKLLLKCEINYATTLVGVQTEFERHYQKKVLENKVNDANKAKEKKRPPELLSFDEQDEKGDTSRIESIECDQKIGEDKKEQSREEKELNRVICQTEERLKEAGFEQAKVDAQKLVSDFHAAFAERLLPFPIVLSVDGRTILDYPGLFDNASMTANCPEEIDCDVTEEITNATDKIIHVSDSVGRLAIAADDYKTRKTPPVDSKHVCTVSNEDQPTDTCDSYFWGTAFVIAEGVIATSCHEIDPLLKKEDGGFKLYLEDGTKLIIDFGLKAGETGHFPATNSWDIDEFLGCGDREGLDIAFLSLKRNAGGKYPPQVTLYSGSKETYTNKHNFEHPHPLALIGYADLEHFADSVTERIYRVFAKDDKHPAYYHDDKFALPDWIVPIPACAPYTDQVFHVASTTVGASGSVLIDIADPKDSENYGKVVAMHTCCANFFHLPKGSTPISDLPCARLTRTFDNQALGSWSILNNRDLCSIVKKKDPDFQCPGGGQ